MSPKASPLPFSCFHLSLWMRDIKTEFVSKGEEKKSLLGVLGLQVECRGTVSGVLWDTVQKMTNQSQMPSNYTPPPPCPPFSSSIKHCKIVGKSLKDFFFTSILSTVTNFKYLFLAFKGKKSTTLHSRYVLTYCHNKVDYFCCWLRFLFSLKGFFKEPNLRVISS